ncbi:MAG: phosphatidylinositol mannoside acyltransferase [Actinobacteria bacterium]|nr:phosphatidylinositol mannoside acyltransferase [Actinomycetota bacterium]
MIDDARGRAAYLAYRAGAELARVVPPAIGGVVADGLARVMRVAWPDRRAQVARTLRRVTGGALRDRELDRAVDEVFHNYARYWHEFFRLPAMSPAEILRAVDLEGVANLDAALAEGRGAILALPHLGNWDLAGANLAARGYDVVAVAEMVDPPELFEWFVESRRRFGIEVIGLGPESGVAVNRALADNRVVCLLADRDITANGIEVEFFGERTTVPGGPALLALRTGAALLPGSCYFTEGGHTSRIAAPIPAAREGRLRADVERVTAAVVHHLEDAIRERPEQWLLMQPNWPSDRGAAAPTAAGAPGGIGVPT